MQNIENRIDTYEGSDSVRLTLQRSVSSFGELSVSWQATPREADSTDYSPAAGEVSFADGQREAYIDIDIVDDDVPEDLQVGAV